MLKGRISLPHHVYLITTVTEQRRRVFTDLTSARLAVRELKRIQDEGAANTLAWVLMPDHLHWLLQLGDTISLSECLRLFKGRSSRAINQHLNQRGTLWQRAFYDHVARQEEDLRIMARYIVANPLRAGLVQKIGDYPHWDAVWL